MDTGFWQDVRQPIESAMGMPPEAYVDANFFALEQQKLFERGWVVVGLVSEAADPSAMLVRQVGTKSVLIVRGSDGKLRGFLNACRHRGTELAAHDCQVDQLIRCPYHRWAYNLSGDLVATPLFDEVPRPDFDPAKYSLMQVRVDTWGALVFVCLDEATMTLTEWLGDLTERMGSYKFESWRVHSETTLDVWANWKLISENFQEYYHLKWVHPELAKVSRVQDHYRYQGPGMYCGQTTSPVSSDERDEWMRMPAADGLDKSDSCSGRFVAVFPNVTLSVLPNHVFLMMLEPISAGHTRERCVVLIPPSNPEVDDKAGEDLVAFWTEINSEDIGIMEQAQKGLSKTLMPPGPLSPRFEEPLNRFHKMTADALTSKSLSSSDLVVPIGDDADSAARYGTGVNPFPPAIEIRT